MSPLAVLCLGLVLLPGTFSLLCCELARRSLGKPADPQEKVVPSRYRTYNILMMTAIFRCFSLVYEYDVYVTASVLIALEHKDTLLYGTKYKTGL